MKLNKILFLCIFVFFVGGFAFAITLEEAINKADNLSVENNYKADEEANNAIELLHKNNITIYDNVEDFMPQNDIRRDEAAKMYLNFKLNVLEQEKSKSESRECEFSDLSLGHSDLYQVMENACKENLFKGHNGKFMPTDTITNAQAVIVLVRLIDGMKSEEGVSHYAQNYIDYAIENDFIDGLGIEDKKKWDLPAKRITIAKLLYRAK